SEHAVRIHAFGRVARRLGRSPAQTGRLKRQRQVRPAGAYRPGPRTLSDHRPALRSIPESPPDRQSRRPRPTHPLASLAGSLAIPRASHSVGSAVRTDSRLAQTPNIAINPRTIPSTVIAPSSISITSATRIFIGLYFAIV